MGQPYQGQPGEEIDPAKVDVYRGGSSLDAKPHEYKVDARGMVKATHGLSVETDSAALSRFGGSSRIVSAPASLQIIQRGARPTHFEIVPRQPMKPSEYQEALDQIVLEQSQ